MAEDVQKKSFIKTTIQSHQNIGLEDALNRGKQAQERIKRFTQTDNIYFKIIILLALVLNMFFILPLFITGLLTKGMHWREQSLIWFVASIVTALILVQQKFF